MADRSVESALARAVLLPRPYSEREVEVAESRVAALVAGRVLRGTLHLDAELRGGFGDGTGGQPSRPCRPCQAAHAGHAGPCRTLRRGAVGAEAAGYLRMLCRTVIEQDGALQYMAAFLARRIPQPAGARVLGCVLQLAGREDGARFWWQYAAGAGDAAAAYCLYLHHLSLGEAWEAELWHRQAAPGRAPADVAAPADVWPAGDCDTGLVLRVLTRLRGDGATYLTGAAAAVIHYVPDAVTFVDDIELPLPEAGFARRIAELTATA